jgi:hypothetical protein
MVPGFVPWRHLRRNTASARPVRPAQADPGLQRQELAWDFEQEKQAGNELSDDDREKWVRYHLPREQQWFRIAEHLMSKRRPN